MLDIKETIVVEGRGDASNLSRVCNANYIITSGLHISHKTYDEISLALKKSGIIIFTDPDSPGRAIRRKITKRFSDYEDKIKHAHISLKEAKKNGDIGVENASEKSLVLALNNVSQYSDNDSGINYYELVQFKNYTMKDMIDFGLSGSVNASQNRQELCENLRISYSNAKSLLKKLNHYKIDIEQIKKVTSL